MCLLRVGHVVEEHLAVCEGRVARGQDPVRGESIVAGELVVKAL